MANVQHNALTGTQLHEPKGADAAAVDTVYVSDGASSGTWKKVQDSAIDPESATYGKFMSSDGTNMVIGQKVWKDLVGTPVARGTGVGWPTFTNFIGTSVDAYAFAATEAVHFTFHLPHDYAIGTDIFLHAHWSHNGTAISGTMRWDYECTYAKGHGQEIFPTPVTGSISYSTVDISTTPRYIHRVDEIQLSAALPTASQLDTDLLEPDGLIMMHFEAGAIPTITGGSPNEPFLFMVDIHYQADIEGTLNKAPNFYT